jgi:uncharacterized protein YprB with RNaseH-like and TPR domain
MGPDALLLARRLARYREQGLLRTGAPIPARPSAQPGTGVQPGAALPPGTSGLPETAGPPARIGEHAAGRALVLAEALGGRVESTGTGDVVWVESDLELAFDLGPLAALPYAVDPLRPLVCLDTETTGLGTAAGTLVFLVGLGIWDGARLVVRQLFLPEQSDEPGFLTALAGALPSDGWLVTYNGRTFDWPLLETRYRLHGRAAPAHAGHFDLLPVARQLWRHRLPDARLATVEAAVADVRRGSDLPGQFIPERYFDYLRTGRGALLRDVAMHNRQDVVSLAYLLVELATRLASPSARQRAHPGDVMALGRAFVRHGRLQDGLECYETVLGRFTVSSGGSYELAQLVADRARVLARLGRRHEAAGAWLELALGRGYLAAAAWIEIAKYREHVTKDLSGALRAAEEAGALAARSRLRGVRLAAIEHDLPRRMARLRRRISRRAALRDAA